MAFGDSLRNLFSNVGNTQPNPDAATTKPPVDEPPRGASGRAHFDGFVQWDEYNTEWLGTQGLLLADRMWRSDADIKRDTLATWSPITSATWVIDPYGGDEATDKDKEAADIARHALFEYMSPNLLGHLAEVGPILIRSGFVDFEQIWKSTTYKGKKLILPKKLDLRLPRTIWKWYQDDDGNLTGIVQFLPNAANAWISATDLLHYRLQAEGDNWTGTSMYRHAWKHYFFKEKLEKLDAIGQERKAVGVPVVYPPTGASEKTKEEVETILANLHTNEVGFILMPGPKAGPNVDESVGWEIEIITFDSSSSNGIRESIDQQTLKCAGAFLADFLELGHHQVGARATAEVQEDPFLTAIKALSELIIEPLNALVARIAMLNVPGIEGPPKLKMDLHDEASLSEISTYAQQLFMAECLTPDPELEDYFRARADFPPADPQTREENQEAKRAGRQAAIEGAQGAKETDPEDGEPKTNQEARGAKIKPGPVRPGKKSGAKEPSDPDRQAAPGKASDRSTSSGPAKPKQLEGLSGSAGALQMVAPVLGECTKCKREAETTDGLCSSCAGTRSLDDLTAPWYENLLSQGRLRDALDGARGEMEAATLPAAVKLAATFAALARGGRKPAAKAPADLVEAFETEMLRLYKIGYETVVDELHKQHTVLNQKPVLTLDDGEGEEEEQEEVSSKARAVIHRRATIAAEHVTNEVAREAERASLSGERSGLNMQRKAESAAKGAIRREALTNASVSLNEGRKVAATVALGLLAKRAVSEPEAPAASGRTGAEEPQQVRGIYTSVLDNRTCDYCEAADDGVERLPDDPALTVPNPECSGGEFCRCTVVWVLSGAREALTE